MDKLINCYNNDLKNIINNHIRIFELLKQYN